MIGEQRQGPSGTDRGPPSERGTAIAQLLLVDDDDDFRALVAPVLARRGFQVREVASAQEATRALEQAPADVIVVDWLLPDRDGISWIAEQRKRGNHAQMVLATARWREIKTMSKVIADLGLSLVVTKPIVPLAFGWQVRQLLSQGKDAPRDARPMSGREDVASDTVIRLREIYEVHEQNLPAKLDELVAGTRHAISTGDPGSLATMRRRAERLRGCAGSIGYAAVGEAAGWLADALEHAIHGGSLAAVDKELARLCALAQARPERESARPSVVASSFLVVDPSPEVQAQLREMGERLLIEVRAASDHKGALALARICPPDAAILGLSSSARAESLRIAADLRALPGLEALPIAFLSEDAGIDDRAAAAHAGARLVLSRPLSEDAFGLAVHQLMSSRSPEERRVVVIGQDPELARGLARWLDDMQVTAVDDDAGVLAVLQGSPPDLAVVDATSPGMQAFDLCRVLRTTPATQDLPILVVTGGAQVGARVAAVEAGADDCLGKGGGDTELVARGRAQVERGRARRDRVLHDPLTGLLLRRAFLEAAAARLAEARRHDRPLSLCLLDLDHLKGINDNHGHLAGDHALVTLGRLLGSRFRAEDLRGRWGGDEFVLVFPGEPAPMIAAVVKRTLAEFCSIKLQGGGGDPFYASFSAGVAYAPVEASTVDALLHLADERLYLAKEVRGAVVAEGHLRRGSKGPA